MKIIKNSDWNVELWFNDVFLFQNYSEINSRKSVSVNNNILENVTLPIISANMNAVSWKRMCETLSRYWWLWILPQDMTFDTKMKIIKHVLNASVEYDTPITVTKKDTVWTAIDLINKKNHWCVVLVEKNKAIWYYTEKELHQNDRFIELENIKPRSIYKVSFIFRDRPAWLSFYWIWNNDIKIEWYKELYEYLINEWEKNVFFCNEDEELIWILNRKDILRRNFFNDIDQFDIKNEWNTKEDSLLKRKLNLWIAIWINQVFEEKEFKHIKDYYDEWVRIFVLDTAHWYQQKMIEAIKKVRSLNLDIKIIAWNVCTWEWTFDLIKAWADWVKVWIWPGAMCTTRMQTWVWRPQFSAIVECADVANKLWWFIVADWWIKYTRDICLALAAWARFVMLWTMLSWTKESVWEVKYDESWALYKENYWMASAKAVLWRNKQQSLYEVWLRNIFNEWISTSKIYLREWLETVWEVCEKLISWLKSSMTYVWAKNLYEFSDLAEFWIQTQSWYNEWTPHWNIVK